jgi:delta 1-pyrroline-5-carboxylate dehydrogenase
MISYHVIYKIIYFSDKNKMYTTKFSSLFRLNQSTHLVRRSFFNQTYINGQWVSSQSGETFKVYNPSNGEEIGSVPDCNVQDAEKAVQAAYNTFQNQWSTRTGKERSVIMRKFNDLILKNKNHLAKILTTEMVIFFLKNKSIDCILIG